MTNRIIIFLNVVGLDSCSVTSLSRPVLLPSCLVRNTVPLDSPYSLPLFPPLFPDGLSPGSSSPIASLVRAPEANRLHVPGVVVGYR